MSEQAAAAQDNLDVKNMEKKKCDKKKKGKGKTTRVVAMASAPMVLGGEHQLMGEVFRIETSNKIIEIKDTETESQEGNGIAKADEMVEGEIAGDGVGGVKAEVLGNGDAVMPVAELEGNGKAPASKPAAGDARKE